MYGYLVANRTSFITLCITMVAISNLSFIITELKYLKYLLFPVSIFYLMQHGRFNRYNLTLVLPFVILLVYSVLFLVVRPDVRVREAYFILCYISPFLVFVRDVRYDDVLYSFKLLLMFFLLSLFFKKQQELNIANSKAILEGTDSFIFGMFYIFFFYNKKYLYALVSIVLVVLTLKRIVLGACVILTFLIYFESFLAYNKKKVVLFFTSFTAIYISYLFADKQLNQLVYTYTGQSIDFITMGRYEIQVAAYDFWSKSGLSSLVFGKGIGSSSIFVSNFTLGRIPLLHNDWAKLVFEFGLFGGILFIWFFANSFFHKLSLSLFLSLSFITDNILIYTNVMFFFLMLYSFLSKSESD